MWTKATGALFHASVFGMLQPTNSSSPLSLFIAILFLLSPIFAQANAHADKHLRVLFIGNSLTYANDMPSMVEALAKESGTNRLTYKTIALPNYGLEDHWNHDATRNAIKRGKWNFVVMQQGPSASAEGRAALLKYGRLFADEIRKYGAVPAMYMVWPATNRAKDFDRVRESYKLAADETGGLFLPAGEAWLEALRIDRSIALFSQDGFHPTTIGSYLAALIIYERLFGETAPESKLRSGSGSSSGISDSVIQVLRRAAKETNQRFPLATPAVK